MDYTELIKDFVQRTIDILNKYEGANEITLLINSLLALLIVPKERALASLKARNWKLEVGKDCECVDWHDNAGRKRGQYSEFVTQLRHAVAHIQFETESTDESKIRAVVFTSNLYESEKPFVAKLNIAQIIRLAERLSSHVAGNDLRIVGPSYAGYQRSSSID